MSKAEQALQGGATGRGSKGPGCVRPWDAFPNLLCNKRRCGAQRAVAVESNAQAGEWTDSFVRANPTPRENERVIPVICGCLRWSLFAFGG